MPRERIRKIIANELDVPVETVASDSSADTFAAWDSLGHMKIILAIEEQFAIRFVTAEIAELNSIDKLVAALGKKGIT